jgi:hypothetical protein
MKRKHGTFFGFAVLLVAAIVTLAGCDTGTGGGSGITPVEIEPEELVGNWVGTVNYQGHSYNATVTISNLTQWSISIPSLSYNASGTYSFTGGVATLTTYFDGGQYSGTNQVIGTATYIGNSRIVVALNGKADLPGTYTLTKVITSADLQGDWTYTGIIQGQERTLHVTFQNGANCEIWINFYYSNFGTYTLNGSVATLYDDMNQVIGTTTYIGNNKAVLELNNKSDFPGTYTLTK